LDLNNILYLLDIETIPSKYDEIFIEFLGTIRYIEIQKDNKISNQDIDIAIGYFKTIQN
jgi:riboflavin biosynthesis protein